MPQSTEIKSLTIVTSNGNLTFKLNDTDGRTLISALQTALAGKQAALVSGTNIKTINNTSILGSGNITVGSDITHQGNVTATSSQEVIFNANLRGSKMITTSLTTLSVTLKIFNNSDNYLWVKNTGNSDLEVLIEDIYYLGTGNGNIVQNVYIPPGDITIPAGRMCEIGIVSNSNGAFITTRNDLQWA